MNWTINSRRLEMDTVAEDEQIYFGETEVWELINALDAPVTAPTAMQHGAHMQHGGSGMMGDRLWFRLTAAFALIIFIGMTITVWLSSSAAAAQFEHFIVGAQMVRPGVQDWVWQSPASWSRRTAVIFRWTALRPEAIARRSLAYGFPVLQAAPEPLERRVYPIIASSDTTTSCLLAAGSHLSLVS